MKAVRSSREESPLNRQNDRGVTVETATPGIADRVAEARRAAPYFALQLSFAQLMSERAGLDLGEAVSLYTNLQRRFGLNDLTDPQQAEQWQAYVSGLSVRTPGRARVAWTRQTFIGVPGASPPPGRASFGCFGCDPPDDSGDVRIHFRNVENLAEVGPLDSTRVDHRTAELRAMFAFVRDHWPAARSVLGGSWLYHTAAYRRLFPPEYGASRRPVDEPLNLNGGSSWGQFLDHRGAVKRDVRRAFLTNLERLDIAAPWRAFPLRPLRTHAPISAFYAFYGL